MTDKTFELERAAKEMGAMIQDRVAEIAEKIWQDYEADIIGQPFELIAAIAAALTAAHVKGRRAGLEEAAKWLETHPFGDLYMDDIRALTDKEPT